MKSRTTMITLFALLILLPAITVYAQETKTLAQQGDDLYEQRGDLAKASKLSWPNS